MQERKRRTRQQLAQATIVASVIALILYGILTLHTPKPQALKLTKSSPDETRNRQPLASATTTTTEVVATISLPSLVVATKPQPVGQTENLCSLVDQYDWPTDVAYRVCIQESGGNANNQNLNDYHSFADCWGSFGLMQVNCGAKINHFDPYENMAQAYSMWKARGWQPWINTCKKVGC